MLKGEIAQIDRQIQEGEKLKKEIADMEEKAAKIFRFVPTEMSLEQGASAVSSEARLAGLSIQSVQTSQNWLNKKTVSVGSVDVRVQGQFNQIMIFLSEMTRKDQIYSLKTVKVTSSSQESGDLSLDAVFEFYRRFEPKDGQR